jgi:pimeloyl-ACP methyl ester carboxylesterase
VIAHFRLGARARDAPVAVALHGITSNACVWLAVARALGERAALVAVDLRGRGKSHELPGLYGIDVHVADTLALLDHLGLERAALAGHSLGAYIVARFAAVHPQRVSGLVLVDGGLPIPGSENFDLDAFLGPALARVKLRFPDRDAYRAWWRQHPALRGGDFTDADLDAYADHDLVGDRSSVVEAAVRADAVGLVETAATAHCLSLPMSLLCAPRGLLDDPNPMQPYDLARAWADADPKRRQALLVPDVNHYTLMFSARGAAVVAGAIADMVGPWTNH